MQKSTLFWHCPRAASQVPLLVKIATYQSGIVCPFLQLLPAFCVWVQIPWWKFPRLHASKVDHKSHVNSGWFSKKGCWEDRHTIIYYIILVLMDEETDLHMSGNLYKTVSLAIGRSRTSAFWLPIFFIFSQHFLFSNLHCSSLANYLDITFQLHSSVSIQCLHIFVLIF